MIAPDANLLIYAYAPADPNHRKSRSWLEAVLSGSEPVGFPILSLYAFLRVLTHPRSTIKALSFADAAAIVDTWLARPHASILYPGDRHWPILQQISRDARARGPLLTDASIAALALEYGATVYTNDRDFARFPRLRWHNPLA